LKKSAGITEATVHDSSGHHQARGQPARIGEILKTEGDGAMLRISVEGGRLLRLSVQVRRRAGRRPRMTW